MKKHKRVSDNDTPRKMPVSMIVLTVGSIIPVCGWPLFMSAYNLRANDLTTIFAIIFPVYIILCGFLAYKCFLIKKEVTYILLFIIWLSYAALITGAVLNE